MPAFLDQDVAVNGSRAPALNGMSGSHPLLAIPALIPRTKRSDRKRPLASVPHHYKAPTEVDIPGKFYR